MSLLDFPILIPITVYYKKNKNKIIIIEDSEAEEILKDPQKAQSIQKIETRWSVLNWRENNQVMESAYQVVNPQAGTRVYNFVSHRDAIIKRALKEWDQTINGQPVPVTPDLIDQIDADIILGLYDKYQKLTEESKEEEKN